MRKIWIGTKYIYYKIRHVITFIQISFGILSTIKSGYFKPPFVLKNGVKINVTRTYYDYLLFYENLVKHIYEKHFPPNLNPKIILDLGAHKGFFSICMALRFPNATIYAVEPSAENYVYLIQNTKNFKNIIAIKKAIWNEKTALPLSVSERHSGGHSLILKPKKMHVEVIETITFDELPKADFIKCDIEGSEYVLAFDAAYVAIEAHDIDKENDIVSLAKKLAKNGFDVLVERPILYATQKP